MSAGRRDERSGPGIAGGAAGAVAGVLAGAILAAAWLVLTPVRVVTAWPAQPEPGRVYLVEGAAGGARSQQWMRKRQLFLSGETVTVGEEELNAAVSGLIPAAEADEDNDGDAVHTGAINFRIRDGELQMAAPVSVSVAGWQRDVWVVLRGGFVERDGRVEFQPSAAYAGSCPVIRLPLAPGLLLSRLGDSVKLPEDFYPAWNRLAQVKIEQNRLRLVSRQQPDAD